MFECNLFWFATVGPVAPAKTKSRLSFAIVSFDTTANPKKRKCDVLIKIKNSKYALRLSYNPSQLKHECIDYSDVWW